MTHTIISPLFVVVPRKTKSIKVLLNLNVYRNLHYRTSNDAKIVYKELFKDELNNKKFKTPVEITYKVYKSSKKKLDKMNIISIVSKFLLDAITEYGCWIDDNDDYIKTETILPTEIDKINPRVEITIKEI